MKSVLLDIQLNPPYFTFDRTTKAVTNIYHLTLIWIICPIVNRKHYLITNIGQKIDMPSERTIRCLWWRYGKLRFITMICKNTSQYIFWKILLILNILFPGDIWKTNWGWDNITTNFSDGNCNFFPWTLVYFNYEFHWSFFQESTQ